VESRNHLNKRGVIRKAIRVGENLNLMNMKRFYFLLCMLCFFIVSISAQNIQDVVYLKNGSIVRGIIIEQIPNQSLKIKTKDGSVFVYKMIEVDKMTKEEIVNNNGNQYQNGYNPNYKSPLTASLLSLIVPGGGQFYNRQYGKALFMFGVAGASYICLITLGEPRTVYDIYRPPSKRENTLAVLGLGGIIGTTIWSITDALISAKKLNSRNVLVLNFKLDQNADLVLQPDFKYDYYGGNNLSPIFGAKLSLNLH